MKNRISKPFQFRNYFNKPGFFIFFSINLIVLFNAVAHQPAVGFDAEAHRAMVLAYSEFRFPTSQETRTYHHPFLPYLFPAIVERVALSLNFDHYIEVTPHSSPMGWIREYVLRPPLSPSVALAVKMGQLQMALVSVAITFAIAVFTKHAQPDNPAFQTYTLALLGMLAVYYKTVVQLRGEPLLAFWSLISAYLAYKVFVSGSTSGFHSTLLGLGIGLSVLSSAFGLLVGPSIGLFALLLAISKRISWRRFFTSLPKATAIAFLLACTFYVPYFVNNGFHFSPQGEQFQNYPTRFSFSNLPHKFFFSLSLDNLFTDPIRPTILNEFFPVFYADMFGDYWSYFLVYGISTETNTYVSANTIQTAYINAFYYHRGGFPPSGVITNRLSIARYLGLVNVFALLPFSILTVGGVHGLWSSVKLILGKPSLPFEELACLWFFFVVTNVVAFLYIAIMYAEGGGDIIKPAYLLQIFPCLALLGGYIAAAFSRKWKTLGHTLNILLVIVTLFNSGTYFTRFLK